MLKRTIFALALAFSAPGFAQIYKCQEGGKTVYSDKPCSKEQIEQINERYDRQRCSQLQANIERYESRMRSGAPARLYGIYKSEQAAAQGQFDRECK